jgi:hypothetical protein
MPISDPSKVIFSTQYRYFLNYDSKTGSVSVPSTAYALGEAKSYTVTIPITRVKDFSQVLVNFSFDSGKWYAFPFGDVVLDLSFGSVSTVGSYSGSNLTLIFYVVNQVGPGNNPAFTANVDASLFITPT